jgi:uncharacterized membrane protein
MSGVVEGIGRLHPALVHFPVALILTGAVAELLYMWRREQRFGDAARFMVAASAWMAVPTAAAGFAAATELAPSLEGIFSVHRITGVGLPVLAFLVYAMSEGARRSGQVWEQMAYRLFLLAAVAGILVAAYSGGLLAHGAASETGRIGVAGDFGLTPYRTIWY